MGFGLRPNITMGFAHQYPITTGHEGKYPITIELFQNGRTGGVRAGGGVLSLVFCLSDDLLLFRNSQKNYLFFAKTYCHLNDNMLKCLVFFTTASKNKFAKSSKKDLSKYRKFAKILLIGQ